MITITLSGFKTKEQAILWLEQYEGSVEQNFDFEEYVPHTCIMSSYINEMEKFNNDINKENFILELE